MLREQALQRAAYLDNHLQQHGKPIGPLHGLPVSVKEQLGMPGCTQTHGFCSQVDHMTVDEPAILKYLAQAGAVFHVRTTEPQTLVRVHKFFYLLSTAESLADAS